MGDEVLDLSLEPDVREAMLRFRRCAKWEYHARHMGKLDYRFCEADSENKYQWPNEITVSREIDDKPCLTVNKVRQHVLQIVNDAKQNKPSITLRPTGGPATKESADVFESVVRSIEYNSNAQVAYDTATEFQVKTGIGYWRVATDWSDEDSLDQEIFIRRIPDPDTVYLDPDIREFDGSDALFGFIFEDIQEDEFRETYPEWAKPEDGAPSRPLPHSALAEETVNLSDHVRVAEYFRKVENEKKIISFVHEGQRVTMPADKLPEDVLKAVVDDPQTRTRMSKFYEVEWLLIVGDKVYDRRKWPGKYIPIVRLIGEETVIDGQLDRKGHVRALKDAQRMYNYWTSEATTQVALQNKIPYIAPVEAIEGYENEWKNANTSNYGVLPYNAYMEGTELPLQKPERQNPPVMAQAYIQGMQIAAQEMMFASGQYQAQMGEPSNERSGKAINERQRQGDNATYHYIDNLGTAIRYTGKILIDLIPKIYDTKRVMQILAEDGKTLQIEVNPQAAQALQLETNHLQEVTRRIFNPQVGKYEVQADIGPAYATKRQEAFNALIQIITQAPNLVGIIGDILLRAADFPLAQDAAERLENMVPPQAKGQGPTPKEQELMAQVQKLSGLVQKGLAQQTVDSIKLKGKDQMRDIDAYRAETDRWKALAQAGTALDPDGLRQVIQALVQESLRDILNPIVDQNEQAQAPPQSPQTPPANGLGAAPPPSAPWFIPPRARNGHYLWETNG